MLSDKKEAKVEERAASRASSDKDPSKIAVGRWTDEEHTLFLEALESFPYRAWKKIATRIETRTVVQIRTHAQKYYQKLQKKEGRLQLSDEPTAEEDITDRRRGRAGSKRSATTELKKSMVKRTRKSNSAVVPASKTKPSSKQTYINPRGATTAMHKIRMKAEDEVHPFPVMKSITKQERVQVKQRIEPDEEAVETQLPSPVNGSELEYLHLPPMIKELEDLNAEEALEWFSTAESQATTIEDMSDSCPEMFFENPSPSKPEPCFSPLDINCNLGDIYNFTTLHELEQQSAQDILDPEIFVSHFFQDKHPPSL